MKLPHVTISSASLKLLAEVSYWAKVMSVYEPSHPIVHHVAESNILKSSLYSARIEGNPLTETTMDSDDVLAKRELYNLVDAVRYIHMLPQRQPLTLAEVKRLHGIMMKEITVDAGMLRKEQNALFDVSGAVRYLPPPPLAMRKDLDALIVYANTPTEFSLITALVTHLVFEKLHPFVDGNGRVGRLLIPFIQKTHGEPLPQVVPLERYLEKHRSEYYRYLDIGMQHIDEYILFMLRAIVEECSSLEIEMKEALTQISPIQALLSPRQKEIFSLIADHPYITMDALHRRFLKVPVRSIRHDVTTLLKKKLIKKLGATRGACYLKSS